MMSNEVEVLISGMDVDVEDSTFFSNFNLQNSKAVMVNQSTSPCEKSETYSNGVRVISVFERGLSKSRNLALANASASICIIGDDDVHYVNGFREIVEKAYDEIPDADIIVFQIKTKEGRYFKNYGARVRELGFMDLMKVSSIEITFKRERIVENNVTFNGQFGLGAQYVSGEEALFLAEAYNKGLKIYYYPATIVNHPIESSGKEFTEKQVISKGALIKALFGWKSLIVNPLFALKKFKESEFGLIQFYKMLIDGGNGYK